MITTISNDSRVNRRNYEANLVRSWIPALNNGVIEDKLKLGNVEQR